MRLFSVATVAAAVLVAGCGASNNAGTSSSNQPAPQTQGGGSTAKATGATTVTIKNFAFLPATVRVGVGTKITFVNDDSVGHDVTATSGASFKSPLFGKGGHYVVTADKAGTIDYVCTVHPFMKAKIVVTG